MSRFLGGSAFNMASQISEGYLLVTPMILKRFGPAELNQLQFELQKVLTDLRGHQPAPNDQQAIQTYHHRLGRVRGAMQVIQSQLARK